MLMEWINKGTFIFFSTFHSVLILIDKSLIFEFVHPFFDSDSKFQTQTNAISFRHMIDKNSIQHSFICLLLLSLHRRSAIVQFLGYQFFAG